VAKFVGDGGGGCCVRGCCAYKTQKVTSLQHGDIKYLILYHDAIIVNHVKQKINYLPIFILRIVTFVMIDN
jgi:hypothetical protein